MAIFNYLELLLFFAMVILFYFRFRLKPTALPTNWPVIGMLPAVLQNSHRIHDFATDILTESGGTFDFRGPWFCNMDMVVTCDPANIHHVFSSNFSNYPKGPEFNKIFEILGDGIFNADFDLWELHRRMLRSSGQDPAVNHILPIDSSATPLYSLDDAEGSVSSTPFKQVPATRSDHDPTLHVSSLLKES